MRERRLQIACTLTSIVVFVCAARADAQGRGGRAGHPPAVGAAPANPHRPPEVTGPQDSAAQPRGRGAGRSAETPRGAARDERSFAVLERNPRLAEHVRALLPPGTDVAAAATGFRNLGQFVAAAQVAHNLGLPFDELKNKIVSEGLNLGQAVHALRPDIDTRTAVRQAEEQARAAIRSATGRGSARRSPA
jgi:hypothetical protein